MNRIESLRKEALDLQIQIDDFLYYFYQFFTAHPESDLWERYGEAFYHALSHTPPAISPGELVVGKPGKNLTPAEKKLLDETYEKEAYKIVEWRGQDSHMAIDYDLLLRCGTRGIIQTIDRYLETCGAEKVPFYQSCKRCLEAIAVFSNRYADTLEDLAERENNPQQAQEWRELATICRNVPEKPAKTFHEAVQSAHFISFILTMNPLRFGARQQFQLGRPDRYLYPYYKQDIENGTLTKEKAQLILDCYAIQINLRVPSGLSCGYMVGGRDDAGQIVENDLTELCMQVIDDIRLVYPSVGLCYTKGMDDRILKKACEILTHGRSHPAIFNDDVISEGLRFYGLSEAESHHYIHSTCVEITPVGSSNVWVASPYTNMPQILLDLMDREYEDLSALKSALFEKLDASICANFKAQNDIRQYRLDNSINPILSCFVNDCLARGIDIEQGGARYNWIMPSFVGMANLVDALYAINELVFVKKEYTLIGLKTILDRNFEGHEDLRMRILNTIPKYGNDIDNIDNYFTEIVQHIVSECQKYKGMHSNGNLIPSVFCWVMHERFGRNTGATPDGRKAGFPLGDGSGPCQGREMNGPTASILSSTKWEHTKLIGGVAVNMKFSKQSLGPSSIDTMLHLIKTYTDRGGFEIQFNIIDRSTLEQACKNPEAYRDLVVRIGGYSDYFTRLSPEMQQEVILRTEHKI